MIADILGALADFAVGVWALRWLLLLVAAFTAVAVLVDWALGLHVQTLDQLVAAKRENAELRRSVDDLRRMAATPAVALVGDELPEWLTDPFPTSVLAHYVVRADGTVDQFVPRSARSDV